jgi:hypothetical protein
MMDSLSTQGGAKDMMSDFIGQMNEHFQPLTGGIRFEE